jgi:hypothetical protein
MGGWGSAGGGRCVGRCAASPWRDRLLSRFGPGRVGPGPWPGVWKRGPSGRMGGVRWRAGTGLGPVPPPRPSPAAAALPGVCRTASPGPARGRRAGARGLDELGLQTTPPGRRRPRPSPLRSRRSRPGNLQLPHLT